MAEPGSTEAWQLEEEEGEPRIQKKSKGVVGGDKNAGRKEHKENSRRLVARRERSEGA